MKKIVFLIGLLMGCMWDSGGWAIEPRSGFPQAWRPQTIVADEDMAHVNLDRCFTAEPIGDEVFSRMLGNSWKQGCPVKRSQLRYLRMLHRNGEGHTQVGEMVVNERIAGRVLRIFRRLYEAGYRIERMVLVDDYGADDEASMRDNNTSGFNFRMVAGTQRVSKHGQGLAIDLNTRYNPCVKGNRVQPRNGQDYAYNRHGRKDIPYKIDREDLAYKLFKEEGFSWGGDWRSLKDYQHFEF